MMTRPLSFASSAPAAAPSDEPEVKKPNIDINLLKAIAYRDQLKDQFEQCQAQLPKDGPEKKDIQKMDAVLNSFKLGSLGLGALCAFTQSFWALPLLAWPIGSELVKGIKKLGSE